MDASTGSPAVVAQELLSTDRSFSQRAAGATFPAAVAAMFDDSVRMPVRDRVLVGPEAVRAALRASPDSAALVRWVPVRSAVSADLQQGFTAGVQFYTRPDGTTASARYLAYWVRDAARGWRVAAWRRRPLSTANVDTSALPKLLPERIEPRGAPSDRAEYRRTLMAAEQGFSDEANRIGVGAAFARLGDDEAINMGRPDDPAFVRTPRAIAALVAGGQPLDAPSAITWNADDAIVASSGDLGITFGVIRPKNPPPTGAPAGAAFFTIWRKTSRTAPWRYVAE